MNTDTYCAMKYSCTAYVILALIVLSYLELA